MVVALNLKERPTPDDIVSKDETTWARASNIDMDRYTSYIYILYSWSYKEWEYVRV